MHQHIQHGWDAIEYTTAILVLASTSPQELLQCRHMHTRPARDVDLLQLCRSEALQASSITIQASPCSLSFLNQLGLTQHMQHVRLACGKFKHRLAERNNMIMDRRACFYAHRSKPLVRALE